MSCLTIFISAVFINNIVLSQLLGISPFIRASQKISSAWGLSGALIIVMPIISIITSLIYHDFLTSYRLEFLIMPAFILIIAAIVQLFELAIKKISPSYSRTLENFRPFLVVNCAVLGTALLSAQKDFSPLHSACFGLANALGFMLAITLFASLRERLNNASVPPLLKGIPLSLITAGLLSMAFMGFAGI